MVARHRVRADRSTQHGIRGIRRATIGLLAMIMIATTASCATDVHPWSTAPDPAPTSTSTSQPKQAAAPKPPKPPEPPRGGRLHGSDAGPLGAPGTWKLAWHDEFKGDSLDLDRWRPNWLANSDQAVTKPINRAERACYDPANVKVKNGSLRLKAEDQACRTHDGRSYDYTSAAIESAHDYRFTYGFAEARIYLPPSDGSLAPKGSCGPNWGVFLLNGWHYPQDGEIDVMECLSDNDVSWHYHYGTRADPQVTGCYPEGWRGDMPGSSGWHTFGVDWKPGRLVFYFDGQAVGTTEEGITDAPHYLVAALAISGTAVAVPQTMKVDYVRVWKSKKH